MNNKFKSSNIGGYGWFAILYGACVFVLGGPFWTASVANVTVSLFAQQIGVSGEALLHTHTITNFIMIPVSLIIGWLYTKFGHRKMSGIFTVISVLCVILWGMADSVAQYAITRFLVLFGMQAISQVGLGVAYGKYFPTKKGYVLGWATVGASASNLVALPVMTALLPKVGLFGTFLIFAIFMLVVGIVGFIFVPDDPAKVKFVPDNGESDPVQIELIKKAGGGSAWTMKEVLKSKSFWLASIAFGIFMLGSQAFMMQIVPFMIGNGVAQPKAVGYVSILAIVGMIGSALSGWVDQKIGTRKTTIILGVGYSAAFLIAGLAPFNGVTLFLMLGFYCAVMGAISNLPASYMIGVFGGNAFSKVYGITFPIMTLISAPGPSILAFSTSATGKLNMAYIVLGVLSIIGIILIAVCADAIEKAPGKKGIEVRLGKKQKANVDN